MSASDLDRTALQLREKPWNHDELSTPEAIWQVPGMLWHQEKRMLYWLARHYYRGQGAIADMGAFLGGSTICLAAGLQAAGFDDRVLHSYDLFKLGDFERREYFPDEPDADPRAVFDRYLEPYSDLVEVHQGDVLTFPWSGGPIEILFVDIAKSYKVMDHVVRSYLPPLIPGVAIVVMQDYLSPQTGPWHHVVLEKLSPYLEYVVDCDNASALFLLREEIPRNALDACMWESIPLDEKLRLMDAAIEKLETETKKDFLRSNRELLVSGRDMTWGLGYHDL